MLVLVCVELQGGFLVIPPINRCRVFSKNWLITRKTSLLHVTPTHQFSLQQAVPQDAPPTPPYPGKRKLPCAP